jgi:hypothetical protein
MTAAGEADEVELPSWCRGRLRAAPGVITVVEGDATILVSTAYVDEHGGRRRYHTLDAGGAALWDLLRVGTTFDDLAARLGERGGRSSATARRDVVAFLRQLRAVELIACDGSRDT